MNNKKIIFGILLFCAISFLAYTFANPAEVEEGKMTYGSGTNTNVNSGNKDDKKDDLLNNNEEQEDNKEEEEQPVEEPTVTNPVNTTTNNKPVITKPSTSKPSGSQTVKPTPTPTPKPVYSVGLKVENGSSNVSSLNVTEGGNATFTISANNGYTLENATIAGGCSLSNNTVTVKNVTYNMFCLVTLDTETIYTNINAMISGDNNVTLSRSGNKVTLSGTMQKQPYSSSLKTDEYVSLKFSAPKAIPAALLNKMKITIGYSGRTYGINAIENESNALNQSEAPYFTINHGFKKGNTYKITIDWGTGKPVTYELLFNIDII